MTPLRIAIVDDLALARAVLRRVIESVPGYQVVWEAANGAQAVANVLTQKPDVLLMDLVMPVLDGSAATKQIMTVSPLPIVIVTSSVSKNLNRVYEALSHGGLDAVNTPMLSPDGKVIGAAPLLAKLDSIARSRTLSGSFPILSNPTPSATVTSNSKLIAIGASTGGPEAVAQVLADLGRVNLPVVVIQHIGGDFVKGLAEWLTARLRMTVTLAAQDVRPAPGSITLAGGDEHLTIQKNGTFRLSPEPRKAAYYPSIDVFFESLTGKGIGILLTGMGSDGARGLLHLRKRGWHTIAQDEATSVVYGMPKAAALCNAAVEVLAVRDIGAAIRRQINLLD